MGKSSELLFLLVKLGVLSILRLEFYMQVQNLPDGQSAANQDRQGRSIVHLICWLSGFGFFHACHRSIDLTASVKTNHQHDIHKSSRSSLHRISLEHRSDMFRLVSMLV
jgi:hypothetical protein